MPSYLIERSFPDGLSIPINDEGRQAVAGVIANNADHDVTWLHCCRSKRSRSTSAAETAPRPA